MKLTDRILASGASLTDLIHIVITGDTSQNPAGSSYKIPMSAYAPLFGSSNTGDTYWTSGTSGNYSIKTINNSGLDATGNYAVAEGYGTIASGATSHAEGYISLALGAGSHAEGGNYNSYTGGTASGDSSHAEGVLTTAGGHVSHAEGNGSIASGQTTHAEGYQTIAAGFSSHSEGWKTTTFGSHSHTEGQSTTAFGIASHAGGIYTIASGDTSFVHGSGSTALGVGSVVLGNNITGFTDNTVYTPFLRSLVGVSAGTFDVTGLVTPNYTQIDSNITDNGYSIIGNFNLARPYGLTANSNARYIGSYNATYWTRDTPYDLTIGSGASLVGTDGAVIIGTSASTTVERIVGVRSSVYSQLQGPTINDVRFFTCNNPNEALGYMYGMQNVYGYYMEPLNICVGYTAGTTNAWGVYIDDLEIKNYLGGDTYIGTNTGNARLHVVGTGTTDTAMIVENGNAAIGTNTPNANALLELVSTNQALLIMRMSATQASAITPSNGMMLYVTSTNATFTAAGFWGYEEGAWVKL